MHALLNDHFWVDADPNQGNIILLSYHKKSILNNANPFLLNIHTYKFKKISQNFLPSLEGHREISPKCKSCTFMLNALHL